MEKLNELSFYDFDNEGRGIARNDEGKIVFVPKAVPGDICEVRITKSNSRFEEGIISSVIKPSEQRLLPYGSEIPGAPLSAVSYDMELSYKQKKVYNCLSRVGQISSDDLQGSFHSIIPSEVISNYRNHMQYKISNLRLCLVDGSDYINMAVSPLAYDIINNAASLIEETLVSTPTALFSEVIIRASIRTKQLLIELVSSSSLSNEIIIRDAKNYINNSRLIDTLTSAPKEYIVQGIMLRISSSRISRRTRTGTRVPIYGESLYEEILLGKRFQIQSGAFFQVNILQAEALYSIVKDSLSDEQRIYDIYCGTGSIGLSLINEGQSLFGLDSVSEAIESAKINARTNNISNAKFICRKAEDTLFEGLPPPDAVIVDPPRKGMNEGFIFRLLKLSPRTIAYISCDPATLARDLNIILSNSAYKLESVTPVDLFPRTAHVETVCLLSRKGSV